MKKLGVKVLAIAMALTLGGSTPATLPGVNNTTVASAATVKISSSKLTLTVGQSKTLTLKNNKKAVTWTSSKKSVATVSSKGKVTAKKAGTATITAKVGSKKYTCKVTVKDKNKACTVGKLKFTIPVNVESEVVNQGGREYFVISNPSGKNPSNNVIVQVVQDCAGMSISYDDWKTTALQMLSEDAQLQQLQSVSADISISNYNQKTVKTSCGDAIFTDISVSYQGEPSYRCCVYDIYANDVWVEVIYNNYDNNTKDKTLEVAVDMIMDTLKVSK